MKTGELATLAGCPVETVRYYEKSGLLHAPLRGENNYRHYDHTHVERLMFIRRCRALDMTQDEIRALLEAKESQEPHCGKIDAIISEHLHHVQQRIQELQALEQQLKALNQHCNADRSLSECGILRELKEPTEGDNSPLEIPNGHLAGVHSH
ncbi:Cd(II)/Pb(II)-responsive transcriptional regulator [Candidatus Pantoea multigeneris]|uniref:Cd(II)/Pb(II)-responsive transcriptional regulator n=1 Tax=Candidatus Pantoea multigeneris TaxID=2608357 RepID=A0ABX0R9W5_9GAMM|nr:Cd(II)/Pb(II)-responsive transcriptional regulator [Pantoea multigeneris]NIF22163.1 Cd(II)/Pb(II)-responsive transcriptional regulator [Pantoea multigeneris]